MQQIGETHQEQKCVIHKGQPLKYLCLSGQKIKQYAICQQCLVKYKLNGSEIFSIEEITKIQTNEVLLNWPIVEEERLLENYYHMVCDEIDKLDPINKIEKFFYDFSNEVNNKIQQCKKNVLEKFNDIMFSENILSEVYNKLAQKDILRECAQGFLEQKQGWENKFTNLVNTSREQSKKNTQILKQNLDVFKRLQNFLKLEEPLSLNKQIIKTIDQIQSYLFDLKQDFQINLKNLNEYQKNKLSGFNEVNKFIFNKQISGYVLNQQKDSIINIKLTDCTENTEFYYRDIMPDKKYIIRLQIEPYQCKINKYFFCIGLKEYHQNPEWIMFFKNELDFDQQVKRGESFYNCKLRFSQTFRQLEFQFCMSMKHYVIADYPNYQNVIAHDTKCLVDLDSENIQYILSFRQNGIENIKILQILEVDQFIPF